MGNSRLRTFSFAIILAISVHTACSNRYEEDCALTSRCEAGQSGSGGGTAGAGATAGVSGANGTASGQSGSGGNGASTGGESAAGNGGGGSEGGGEGGQAGSVGSCDKSASPREESCVLEQGGAVYVSPDGSDETSHNGTRGYPVKSFERALSLAGAAKLPIVVCAGVYSENIEITSGARIYGGFECETWGLSEMPTVVKPAKGIALTIRGVPEGQSVEIEGVEFHAESGSEAGESSIAAVIENAKVELRKSRLVAGDGQDGESGAEAAAYSGRAANGNAAMNELGGAAQECTCGTELTQGGRGGGADSDGSGAQLPEGGADGTPDWNVPGAGKGGDSASPDCLTPADAPGFGRPGAAGPEGTELGEGAKKRGSWSAEGGYMPEAGQAGGPGKVGQGGGGGRGGEDGGGGGGGCGGCGGQGGKPGKGGGASIALIAIDSEVSLSETQLEVGKGGQGGKGAQGQAGQLGGFGGSGDTSACQGGQGGPGGKGAAGGGGAGGIAVGILYQGTEPVTDGEGWFRGGEAGEGGEGGDPLAKEDDGRAGGASVRSLRISEL